MRQLRNKLRKSLLVFINLSLILIFFSLAISMIENITRNLIEINNENSENFVEFSFKNELSRDEKIEILKKLSIQQDVIIKYNLSGQFDYDFQSKGILFTNKIDYGYNILEGRFFNANDFNNNKKVAIIGKNCEAIISMDNGKRFIERGLDKFEVIGIIGKEDLSTRYDDLVLYNLDSEYNNNSILYPKGWVIDSKLLNSTEIKELLNNIAKDKIQIVQENNITYPNPLEYAIRDSKNIIICFSFIILCIFLTFMESIQYWINNLTLEIGIRKKCGASNKSILKDILLRFLIISIFSLITTLAINKILFISKPLNIDNVGTSPFNVLICVLFLMLIGFFTISIIIFKIFKKNISVLLKNN